MVTGVEGGGAEGCVQVWEVGGKVGGGTIVRREVLVVAPTHEDPLLERSRKQWDAAGKAHRNIDLSLVHVQDDDGPRRSQQANENYQILQNVRPHTHSGRRDY